MYVKEFAHGSLQASCSFLHEESCKEPAIVMQEKRKTKEQLKFVSILFVI
jgi:hypothetical protein